MKQETLDFLTGNGYHMWREEETPETTKYEFQKRVPEEEGWPLCECNDKLLINLVYSKYTFQNGMEAEGFEMNIVHERKDGEWCDFKVYGLTEEQISSKLINYETSLKECWNTFYSLGEN